MISTLILLFVGIFLLVKSADYLVDGASAIASRFGISSLVIGLTVVAFGTSAPELVVNVIAGIQGNADIALGNINGSNLANMLLVLGVIALIAPVTIKRRSIQKEIPFMILALLMLAIFLSDKYILDSNILGLDKIDGFALLGFFSIFLVYMFYSAKETGSKGKVEVPDFELPRAIFLLIGGLLGLVIGGSLTVNSAIELAGMIGLSQGLIGATIIAIGTSLPELATAISAAKKGQTDMAIGNVVGSNIFNIFMVLGLTAVISPQPLITSQNTYIDAIYAFLASIVLYLIIKVNLPGSRKNSAHYIDGLILLLLYAVYIVFLIYRG